MDRSYAMGVDVVVSGQSHLPSMETADGVLFLNPGRAGQQRFSLAIITATLEVTPDGSRAMTKSIDGGRFAESDH